jgi:stage II sporulation protein D
MSNLLKKSLLGTILFLSINISPVFSEPLSEKIVKVGLAQNLDYIPISTSNKGIIYLYKNNTFTKLLDINPQQFCSISIKKNNVELTTNNKTYNVTDGAVLIKSLEDDKYAPLVFGGNHWYRGYLEIFANSKGKSLTLVNALPLEEYLYGVVPSEMPASWPIEALKTQAIAARTYVLSHLGQFSDDGFDILPTTASQVYGGVEEETPISNQAVNETRGKVVTYKSKLISAYYSSSAGGMTESGLDAWGSYIPYLKPVKDFDQDSPRFTWYKTISNDDIKAILLKDYFIDVGNIIKISVNDVTSSGRAKTILFEGDKGKTSVDAKKWRISSKLSSTLFSVMPVDPGTRVIDENLSIPTLFRFSGRGFGHGAGMSQWGARFLAKMGRSAEDILKYYYQGTDISYIDKINK